MNQSSSIEESNIINQDKESLSEFIKQFETLPSPEEKLQKALKMMREFVEQKENLPFKDFWEVRKLCLPLFKENISRDTRGKLWNEYIDLTREGREMKNLLDEEAGFAAEQIEIAIKAIEDEIESFHNDPSAACAKTGLDFPEEPKSLKGRYSFYIDKQKALNLLNTYAQRIISLRKELVNIPMRFRFKNKFFERLSLLGDKVFPLRRDCIKEVSVAFEEDVRGFIEDHFSEANFSHEKIKRSVFFFREEIKTLQAIAKLLTLNTHAFTVTREELSKCWDLLKGMEKELKKEYSEQKAKSQENLTQVIAEIEEIKQKVAENTLSDEEIFSQCDEIFRRMRECELTRSDFHQLKDELQKLKDPILAKREEEEKERKLKETALEEKRRNEIEDFKTYLEAFKARIPQENIDILSKEMEESIAKMPLLVLSKKEKLDIERTLKRISQELEEKREENLLSLSDDDRKVFENLTEILEQRKERRLEIKKQIEEYRKTLGSSSLDFSKAMEYNELVNLEKERLEKIDEGIHEIEKKIKEIKKKT